MAVENGYGAQLDMVVDEENNENNLGTEKTNVVKKDKGEDESKDSDVSNEKVENDSNKDDEPTTVVMEVDEEQDTDPLATDNDSEDKIITASTRKTDESKEKTDNIDNVEKTGDANNGKSTNSVVVNDNSEDLPPAPVVTEYVKEYTGRVGGRSSRSSVSSTPQPTKVKIKEEPSEIVLIDSEDEKEEKPKVKVVAARNVQPKPPNTRPDGRPYNSVSNSRNNSDFQIVSVDDDSPMNKNDPMNVFLCSTEEREFRKDYFKDPSSNVLKQRLHCTICDVHIGACPQNSKNMVCHRALKVLICRKCANFYGQGDFPQDEGSDEFCRWCGEGGEVFLCNSCSNVFCQACILRNFGMGEVKRVDRLENWDCYVCDTRPLWTLRAIAFALFTYVRRIKVVAYRNGMYQTINSSNAKVSKSDLMALETDLSTCCPKEVKAAAAAASVPAAENENQTRTNEIRGFNKAKENKVISNQSGSIRITANKVVQNKSVESSPQFASNNVYNQQLPTPRASSSKRSKQQAAKSIPSAPPIAPAPSWQQPQPSMLPEYYGPPGKRIQNQPSFALTQPSVMYPQPSTLRSALVGQQPTFVPSQPLVPNSFGNQTQMILYGGASAVPGGKDGQSEPPVLHWFNGILISLMETIKNIENRLVFIRNSTSNLIAQTEVSFLVNQLHNLLKVSCSKMQEVDCDLLKNYKEFIDKSDIRVNDYDDIVKEFPEFFKPTENNDEPPESVDTDPEPPDDFINPMALVEVIEEGEQPAQSAGDSSKQTSSGKESEKNSSAPSSTSNSTPSSTKNTAIIQPCSVTIKKEVITCDDVVSTKNASKSDKKISDTTEVSAKKRKSDSKDNGKSKVQILENVRIKKEIEETDDGVDNESELEKLSALTKCSVTLENINSNVITGKS